MRVSAGACNKPKLIWQSCFLAVRHDLHKVHLGGSASVGYVRQCAGWAVGEAIKGSTYVDADCLTFGPSFVVGIVCMSGF